MGKPDKVLKGAVIRSASDAQLSRLTKLVAKLETAKLNHAQAILQADTADAREWIPGKLMAKIETYKCKLENTQGTAEKLLVDKQFSPDAFKAFLEDCKDVGTPFRDCLDQMATLVGLAED